MIGENGEQLIPVPPDIAAEVAKVEAEGVAAYAARLEPVTAEVRAMAANEFGMRSGEEACLAPAPSTIPGGFPPNCGREKGHEGHHQRFSYKWHESVPMSPAQFVQAAQEQGRRDAEAFIGPIVTPLPDLSARVALLKDAWAQSYQDGNLKITFDTESRAASMRPKNEGQQW